MDDEQLIQASISYQNDLKSRAVKLTVDQTSRGSKEYYTQHNNDSKMATLLNNNRLLSKSTNSLFSNDSSMDPIKIPRALQSWKRNPLSQNQGRLTLKSIRQSHSIDQKFHSRGPAPRISDTAKHHGGSVYTISGIHTHDTIPMPDHSPSVRKDELVDLMDSIFQEKRKVTLSPKKIIITQIRPPEAIDLPDHYMRASDHVGTVSIQKLNSIIDDVNGKII